MFFRILSVLNGSNSFFQTILKTAKSKKCWSFYFGVNLYYCFKCLLSDISFFLSFVRSFFMWSCYLLRTYMCLNICKCYTYVSVVKVTFIEDIAVRRRRFLASRSQDSLHKYSEFPGSFNRILEPNEWFLKLNSDGCLTVIQHIDCSSIVNMHKNLTCYNCSVSIIGNGKAKKLIFFLCYNEES